MNNCHFKNNMPLSRKEFAKIFEDQFQICNLAIKFSLKINKTNRDSRIPSGSMGVKI